MAETIGLAIISAVTASATTGAVVGAYAVAGISLSTIVGTTALVGGSLLFQSAFGQQPKQRNETQQSVLNQAMGPRIIVYGRTMVGGSRYLFETRNGALFQGIILSAREIDRIEGYYIGDRKTVTSAGENGGIVTDFPQTNKVSFEPHYGTDDQAASPTLLSQLPGIWTADHRLRGLAHVVVVFLGVKREEQQIVYPQSYATPLRFLVRGAKVWDPTNGAMDPENKATWTWSENAADCILDYLRHRDGMRFARSRIDVPSFIDMHGLCAETVTRKDGSTEPRYRLGGTYALNEAPKDVLARMLSTCDGQLVRGPTDLIGIRGGRFRNPLVNIPTEQIIAADLTQGNDRLDAYNLLKVSYTEPDNFYQPTEIQARQDFASQAQVGVIDSALDLAMVPSWTQAARLAKIKFAKDNPQWRGSTRTTLAALDALDQETARIVFDPLGDADVGPMMDTPCTLTAFGLDAAMTGCTIGFTAISADAYAWNPATEEPPRPALPNAPAPVNIVPTPVNVTVNPSRRTVAGGATAVWGVLSWNADARTDLTAQAQYRIVGSGESGWQPMGIRGDGLSAEVGPLTDGQTYDFRVRWIAGNTPSNWSNIVTLATVADANAAAAPYAIGVEGVAGGARFSFTASSSLNVAATFIHRRAGFSGELAGAAVADAIACGPNQRFESFISPAAAGPYRYWLVSRNASGYSDASSVAGPFDVTVT
ncbi:hypothetical protein [Methylorubrum thiocyanatum]|uniref:hypothetical protein n=1 Tax=Methylorubrum thiocyanatum TaxID=47958 RepID=UPI0035C84853